MEAKPRAFLFLAEGFEITEAMAPADILVRGGVELHIISTGDSRTVKSAQHISVTADITLDGFNPEDVRKEDILIFPGGMPGTKNLAACSVLMDLMRKHFAENGTVAAICAAPGLVLSLLPLEETVKDRGKLEMTCYKGFEPALEAKGVTVIDQKRGVVADGNIISASGAGHAVAFGLKILEYAAGRQAAESVAAAIML